MPRKNSNSAHPAQGGGGGGGHGYLNIPDPPKPHFITHKRKDGTRYARLAWDVTEHGRDGRGRPGTATW